MEYIEWNKLLFTQFFKKEMAGQEVYSLQVSPVLLDSLISGGYNSYLRSIKWKVPVSKNFFEELGILIKVSKERVKKHKTYPPEYFGLLIFLIVACAEGDSEQLNLNNVYDRINRFASDILGTQRWSDISRKTSRDIIAEGWKFLQEWTEINNLNYGKFVDYKAVTNPYANSILRHVLINQGHLDNILDLLIDKGYIPGELITREKWVDVLANNSQRIKAPKAFFDLLKEDSAICNGILGYIEGYIEENFNDRAIASPSSNNRKPAIPLRISVNFSKFSNRVTDVFVRAYSHDLSSDEIFINGSRYGMEYELAGYSNKLVLPVHQALDGFTYKSQQGQRFNLQTGIKWLVINQELEEWVESSMLENASSFAVLCSNSFTEQLTKSGLSFKTYYTTHDEIVFLRFSSLNVEQHNQLLTILGLQTQKSGRIILEGAFVTDRRTTIFQEMPYRFSYSGYVDEPVLVAVASGETEVPLEKKENILQDGTTIYYWVLPHGLLNKEFKIKEVTSNNYSHLTFTLRTIEEPSMERAGFFLKDKVGNYWRESTPADIIDMPSRVYDNITEFNQYYYPKVKYFVKEQNNFLVYDHSINPEYNPDHLGDLLLRYISNATNINTSSFPFLLQQVYSSLPRAQANRIMYQWRSLGYIDYEDFGKGIKVNDSTLFFLPYHGGILAYLTGKRSNSFITQLKEYCSKNGIDFIVEPHSEENPKVFPQKIMLFSKYPLKEKFTRLCSHFDITIKANEVYQLYALYYQLGMKEYIEMLQGADQYDNDHHRKQVFNAEKLGWDDSVARIEDIPSPALIKYDGFKDNSIEFVFKMDTGIVKIKDYSLVLLYLLKHHGKEVLYRKFNKTGFSDLLVSSKLPLPYWLEKALMLCTASNPRFDAGVRVYSHIPDTIIDYIETKLQIKIKYPANV
ncbi:hypothetical protein [Flavisolibacter tropicus]|uniref:Uncharacterized protein n=1 Tax=Flavisolibacter tropicus TaxID=1492898 RepID=A0A172TWP4_9BACT|nr:hypothetical protein [Flavisolibacter tropicus]ANE51509.1 hypothetical protein SY85_14355 [Flavisolibacter tropicus]